MRVLYLTPGCYDKGGISRYSRYQIQALRKICGDANIKALSLLGPDTDAIDATFQVSWHGDARPGQIGKLDRIQFSARAMAFAGLWRPDLIVSAHVNFGRLVTAAAAASGAQTILNVYGLELWSGLSEARRGHMRRVSKVLADCHATAEYVIEARLHSDAPTVIWDPVDLATFTPGPIDPAIVAKYRIPDPQRHFVVMSLGRLAKAAAHKGYDRLIQVVAGLVQQAPNLRLVIAGRGDDRPRLEALAASLGVSDRVVFAGAIDETDLAAVYRCANVFSLVSDKGHGRGEGIPLTPLEAMACGAPIIVGDEDGSKEAVFDGRNGFVVSPRILDDHKKALLTLIQNSDMLSAMRQESRKIAVEHFAFDKFVAKHERLLAQVHSRTKGSRPAKVTA